MSLLSVLLNASLFAQNSSFSFSFSGGSGFLPLLDVIDFTKTTPLIMDSGYRYDFFQKDNSGKYFDLKFVYHYTDKHRVSLNIEYITISAEGKTTHMGYNGYIGTADQDSKITAVPIGLSYEYVLGEHGKGFSLLFGAGPSLYISKKVRKELFYPIDDYDKPRYTEYSQTGLGSGLHFYLQLQQSLTTRMFILSRLRARYAKGLQIVYYGTDYDVDFTGVDLTFGLGWRF